MLITHEEGYSNLAHPFKNQEWRNKYTDADHSQEGC